MRLSERMDQSKCITAVRKVLMSDAFMLFQLLIAGFFVVYKATVSREMIATGDVVLAGILALILIFCEDAMTAYFPFMLIATISIKCYNSFNMFMGYAPFFPIPIVALLFHLIVYRRKFTLGKTWVGALGVAIAVTLGGLGKITAAEYFSGTALFYTYALGFGMLLAYFVMNAYFEGKRDYSFRYRFAFLMTLIGFFCVFMIVHHYILFWPNFAAKWSPLYFQWRNNVSTILLLTMPFAFYLSSTYYAYFFVGCLEFIAVYFTGSRGGIISATLTFTMCLAVLIYCDKRNRKKTLYIVAGTAFAMLTFFLQIFGHFIAPVLARLADGDEIREGLIARAVLDFKSNFLFGRGLGYNGNTDIHTAPKFAITWYHSSPFQVIGSFGLVGVLAFLLQLYNRMQVVFKRITQFNLTLFVAYAGLFLMSLVNPGEFCPIPYGLTATLFFILCDMNNKEAKLLSKNDKDAEQVFTLGSNS